MAVENGLNTNGAFPVYNTSGSVDTYAKIAAQQQAKRIAEQKSWEEKLSKLNPEGVREKDKNKFYKLADDWKQASMEARNEKDPRVRFEKQGLADKYYSEALNTAYASKEKTKRDAAVGMKIMGKPHFFNKEGKALYERSLNAEVGSSDDIQDYNSIPLGHDLNKVQEKLAKIEDQVMQAHSKYTNTDWQNDGRGLLSRKRTRKGDVAQFAESLRTALNSQDDMEAFFELQYPDLDWDNNPNEAKEIAIADYVSKVKLERQEADETRNDPNYISPAERERLSMARQRLSGDKEGQATWRQDVINRFLDKDDNAIQEIGESIRDKALQSGATSISGKGYLRVDESNPKKITITVPQINGKDAEGVRKVISPERKFVYDRGNREQAAQVLNTLMNQYTNEKETTSKLLTPQGKKKVPNGQGEKEFKGNEGMVTVTVNGKTGQIPKSQLADFKKKYPSAKVN